MPTRKPTEKYHIKVRETEHVIVVDWTTWGWKWPTPHRMYVMKANGIVHIERYVNGYRKGCWGCVGFELALWRMGRPHTSGKKVQAMAGDLIDAHASHVLIESIRELDVFSGHERLAMIRALRPASGSAAA